MKLVVATPSQYYMPDRRVGTLYYRLTRIKKCFPDRRDGTLYYRLTRIKSVIFPIAGMGPYTIG